MKPKYKIIADDIRKKIFSNQYAIGQKIPTESQLQHHYRASRYTVRQSILELVSEGYLYKKKGSGTYVTDFSIQKDSRTTDKKLIGVITTYISEYIFPTIIRGIEKELGSNDYSLLLVSTNNNHAKEKECLDRMIRNNVDGLIVEPTKSNQFNPNLATYLNLRELGIPVVMINASYEEIDTPFICVDDVEAGFIATKELIDNNHKHLLLITKIDDMQGKYRMKGFFKACEKYSITIQTNCIVTYTTETVEEVYQRAIEELKNNPEITGIVCYNDKIANVLVNNLISIGYSIPKDYSIVGNDDSNLSFVGGINLTTIIHPKEKMGIDAAKWMIKTIENHKEGKSVLYSPKIVLGESIKKL